MFYHASGTAWSGTWDVVAQIPYASFLCVYSLTRLAQSKVKRASETTFFWYLYGTTTIVFSVPRLMADIEYAGPIAGLVLAFLVFEVVRYCNMTTTGSSQLTRQSRRYLVMALICILLGYIVLLLSTTGGIWCFPTFFLQGHALWHLSSSATTVCIFLFFITDGDDESVVAAVDKEGMELLVSVG